MSELTSLGHLLFVQSKKGYRHNIDSVLIANFIYAKNSASVLDVGSGDGIISIILKNKFPQLKITGIELQENLYYKSIKNRELNNLDIDFINNDFFYYEFPKNSFDIILTNPPYYPVHSGRCSINNEKNLAKHEIAFDLGNFLKKAKALLKNSGCIYFIYPVNRCYFALNAIKENKLFIRRLRFIHSTIDENSVLVMFHLTNQQCKSFVIEKPLIIYKDKLNKIYTDEVKNYLFKE